MDSSDTSVVISASELVVSNSVSDGNVVLEPTLGKDSAHSDRELDVLETVSKVIYELHPETDSTSQTDLQLEVSEIYSNFPILTNCIISLPAIGSTQTTLPKSPVKRTTPFKPKISSSKKAPLPSHSSCQPGSAN